MTFCAATRCWQQYPCPLHDPANVFSPTHKEEWLQLIPEGHRLPRVSRADFFAKNYDTKKPCIISDIDDWQCAKWTPEFLQEVFEAYQHTFRYGDGAADDERKSITMHLKEYIQSLFFEHDARTVPTNLPQPPSKTEKLPYARHIGPLTGKTFSQVEIESLFPAEILSSIEFRKFLFVGATSTKTNNHYDWSDNFVYCVKGIKHVTLLPPRSEQQMSNISEDFRAQLERGDCFFVDDGPNFTLDLCHPKSSTPMPVQKHHVLSSCPEILYSPLFPGDLVFFPAYWYHYFHNVTSTISVTVQTYAKGAPQKKSMK